MQQLKIVSIFLVWIWANISLQKSIPECRLSSSGLEACASKCFWNDGSRETVLCKWDLTILGDPSLVFPHDFTHPPPSPNWSLWRSLACERAISISCRVICHLVDWAARTHTREDANKHYEASLFLFDRKPQWTSPPNLTPAFLIKREKGGKKTAKKRYITNHYWLLFLHLLFRACLIIITESANCCFLFDLPGTTEVLSGPVCLPPIFLPFR